MSVTASYQGDLGVDGQIGIMYIITILLRVIYVTHSEKRDHLG